MGAALKESHMDPKFNAFLTQLKLFLVLVGGLMAEQGLAHTSVYKYLMLVSGSLLVIGNSLWALWASFDNWWKAAAIGAQSGINLTLSGHALAADGETVISQITPGSTPTKQVTEATTKEIVKNFAPAVPIAKV
jgi:hypothetical protein